MSCNIDKERLRAYVLQCCTPVETEEIDRHLRSCEQCRRELAAVRRTAETLTQAFDEEPPEWLLQRTLARVEERMRRRSPYRLPWGIPVAAGALAVLLLLVFNPAVRMFNRQSSSATMTGKTAGGRAAEVTNDNIDGEPSLFDMVSGEMEIEAASPVEDRSIYEVLEIAPDIARLLL